MGFWGYEVGHDGVGGVGCHRTQLQCWFSAKISSSSTIRTFLDWGTNVFLFVCASALVTVLQLGGADLPRLPLGQARACCVPFSGWSTIKFVSKYGRHVLCGAQQPDIRLE